MSLKWILIVAFFAASCTHRQPFALPAAVDGWTLASNRELPLESAPPPAAALGLVRVLQGDYAGPAGLRVTVYEMKSDTAFELMQKWRRQPDTFPFYAGRFLVVVQPVVGAVERDTLDRFSRAFEKGLPAR